MSVIVIHIPHASTDIPADCRASYVLNDVDLEHELRLMTDAHTDDLFDVPFGEAIRFPVSRVVLDPERFTDDALEPMSARGMGVVYTRTAHQQPLRLPPTVAERASLIQRFYDPHHARLTTAVDAALAAHGRCLVLDAHSFASSALPYELDQSPDRPDICLGTDAFHTPAALLACACACFEHEGWSVAVDRPFAGALVPMTFYQRDPRVSAIMVEVNRGLYMDESTGHRSAAYDNVRTRLQRALTCIADAHQNASRVPATDFG